MTASAAPDAARNASGFARRHRRGLSIAALAALLVLLLILLWDWNWLKPSIERRVSASTGREFRIDGDLGVKLSMQPRVTMHRLRLSNLPGNAVARMASVERLQFRLHVLPLLRGDWVLSEVRVSQPQLLLEKNRAGEPNWVFRRGGREWPEIRDLEVDAGTLAYRNPVRGTSMDFVVRSGAPQQDARLAPLLVSGRGRYVGNVVEVEGRVDSPLRLKEANRPYHIEARAHAGATRATADGHLIAPLQFKGFDLQFGLSGPNLALLYPLIGIAVPDTPPYHLLGQLRHEAKVWNYENFSGVVGDSDLSGDATLHTGGARPKLVAELVSKRLDFDDLGGFVGAPPQTGRGESASPEQQRQAAERRASARVLPDQPYQLEKIRSMDADVKLRAQHLVTRKLPLEAMSAHLFVEDGVLRLDPLEFRAAGGEIESHIRLDARKATIVSRARVRARGLSLPKLFPDWVVTEDSVGRLGGSLELAGSGNSIADMLASSDGKVSAQMGSGRISNLAMEKAGIDIQEMLKFMLGKDRTIPIRCAFGDFNVDNGVMVSRALAFDTSDTVILGHGSISLREERLDLKLKPLPKDHSLLALRAPLKLTGSFKDPEFRPDVGRIALRAVAAAVLAAIAPPAALIATFETGPGKDVACRPGEKFDAASSRWLRSASN